MKYWPIILLILVILAFGSACWLIYTNTRPVPHVELKTEEVVFDAEAYLRSLKAQKRPFNDRGVHRLVLQRTRQKQGVYLESMEPALDSAALEIINAFHVVMGFDYVPVITSGNDYPYHARNSKHYENKALDFRLMGLKSEERRSVIEMSQKRLEGRARVLWEKGEAEHLHVELLE